MPHTAGIDLGTTFSSVAYVDGDGNVRVARNANGQPSTPSVVLIEGDQFIVGEIALNQWVTNEEHVVRWIKRAIGDENYRFQGRSAIEISAEILKVLKADAEAEIGAALDEVVITCPAYFSSLEIENTKKAGELANLNVREIVKEPTAAAVFYGVEHMQEGETVVVCDLGGGTYDATVLRFDKGRFIPLSTMGSRQTGGHDWTTILTEMVAEQFEEDPRNDLLAGQMLYEACEQAKRDFSKVSEVQISIPYQGKLKSLTVSRSDFETRTEWKIQEIVMWTRETLAKASKPLTWRDIDRVLLVGGSSRLRRMGEALEEVAGKKCIQIPQPDLAVALGAAALAAGKMRTRNKPGKPGGLVEVEQERIIPRSLGTRTVVFRDRKPKIVNTLMISKNSTLPISKTRENLKVSSDGQKFFEVPVVEFEDEQDFDQVGNFRFYCPDGVKKGDPIRITFHYDISGIADVEAVYVGTGSLLIGERLLYEEPDLESMPSARQRPRWVVFALDTSGSMDRMIHRAKDALLENSQKLFSAGECRIGVVRFDSRAEIVCEMTTDFNTLKRALDGVVIGGTTAMDEGIDLARELLAQAPAGALRELVMVTDGMPDSGRRGRTLEIAASVRDQAIELAALGLGSEGVDLDYLKQLTPHALVIEPTESLDGSLATLLTLGTEPESGGLVEQSVLGGLEEQE